MDTYITELSKMVRKIERDYKICIKLIDDTFKNYIRKKKELGSDEKCNEFQHDEYDRNMRIIVNKVIEESITIIIYWLFSYEVNKDSYKENHQKNINNNYNIFINQVFKLLNYTLLNYGRQTLDLWRTIKYLKDKFEERIRTDEIKLSLYSQPFIIGCKDGKESYTCGRGIKLSEDNHGIYHIIIFNTVSEGDDFMDDEYAEKILVDYNSTLKGGYKNKYLKYKQKYINLKNK